MAYDQQAGTSSLRATYIDSLIKQVVSQKYKFKQFVLESSTSAWNNVFYREDPTTITDHAGNQIKGIPRGAAFPQGVVSWERVSTIIEKYGLEATIPWEDLKTDEIGVQERTAYRIAERVARAVDDEIWDSLTESATGGGAVLAGITNIQKLEVSFKVGAGASGAAWNESSAAIIDNLEAAEAMLATYNYDTSDILVAISPTDKRYIVKYLYEKGAQAPSISERMVDGNGVIGKLGNKTFIVSNSVTASMALLAIPKICANWKTMEPLGTTTKEDPYKSWMIRACEVGVTQLTDPKAIVLLYGTQR